MMLPVIGRVEASGVQGMRLVGKGVDTQGTGLTGRETQLLCRLKGTPGSSGDRCEWSKFS